MVVKPVLNCTFFLSDLVFRYVGYENSEDRKIKSLVLKGCDASFLPDLIRDKLNLCS